ncbi:zinc-finger homeodomain protein 2 [Selaginella moellendorffii]|uniref:zinc-finger homeodomain protein 2 n=1 Tax=Selaginella moellendorffii TaxID=88036 RepID=UPI000D1CD109|nr:zinc-finger homeodomain protein 2 [Selaginella moellendorffii]|eukprot:XP_024542672.1 zinc-finger homeodomain protein 2 [Selaginella moellendorffii]
MDSTLNPPLHDHGEDESKHRGGSPVLYKECVRNINAENGGEEVHDGCQKFTAAGKDGSPEALKCAACGCHRNFHQQESETPTAIKGSDLTQFADDILGVVKKTKRKNTHRAINLATQVLEHVSKLLNILAQVIDDPDDTGKVAASGQNSKAKAKEEKRTSCEEALAVVVASSKDKAQSPDDSTPKEKRKRTIFSAEQLTKLEALAESVHWSLGNIPKDQQASAAMEIGITVESLKYWFHNRKQKKKPTRKS